MKTRFAVLAGILAMMAACGFVMCDAGDTSVAEADAEYIVYFIMEDEQLDNDQYSIDCEGVYVTDTYVFFKKIVGTTSTTIGTLPETQNIVSRYYGTTLADDGFVLNPEGTAPYGYDASGWFTDKACTNRISSTTTLGELDSDGNHATTVYMKAAKVYDVQYHARNYQGRDPTVTPIHWYDGYYLEQTNSAYDEGRFADVAYTVSLVEGQVIGDTLADATSMFYPQAGSKSLKYLALAYWAIKDGTYDMDAFDDGGGLFTWVLWEEKYGSDPAIDPENCTPIRPGMTFSGALDGDGDGTIILYGTSTRSYDEDPTFFVSVTYAQQDTSLRNYGDDRYDGLTDTVTLKVDARISGGTVSIKNPYVWDIPAYDGFTYASYSQYRTDATYNATLSLSVSDGVATLSTCSMNSSAATYSVGLVFYYERESVEITVDTLSSRTVTGYYGCDLELPVSFDSSHTLYEWRYTNLSNAVWISGPGYFYTVSLADVGYDAASIIATWQQDQSDMTIYTVVFNSRVGGVSTAPEVVTDDNYVTLPMICNAGYSHLGWALIDPDSDIDYDSTSLVIYPGRTSFTPRAVSSEYKIVNGDMVTVNLYAIWCTTYTIVFDANGGTGSMDDIEDIMVTESVTLPANAFTRNNRDFAGWSRDPDGAVEFSDMATVRGLSANANDLVTLYAIWTQDILVVYDGVKATSGSMSSQIAEGSAWAGYYVDLNPNQYSRTGYTFFGWATTYADAAYDDTYYTSGIIVYNGSGAAIGYVNEAQDVELDNSITLFAIWKPITYYVAFDANGGTGSMAVQEFDFGVKQALLSNAFTKAGYDFGGWSDSSGNRYENCHIVSNLTSIDGATVTLYAIWSAYHVIFDANDGSGRSDVHDAYTGIDFTIPDNVFTYIGHYFIGWNTSADGTGTSYPVGSVHQNLASEGGSFTLYAIWELYYYYIAFEANGGTGSMATLTVDGGESVALINTFTYAHHLFEGWALSAYGEVVYADGQIVSDIGTGVTGETITLYAIWSDQVVTITVKGLRNSNGNSVSDENAVIAFGVGEEITVGMSVDLSLGSGSKGVASYSSGFNRRYLSSFTDNSGNVYAYGSTIVISSDLTTLTAAYTQYINTLVYNINIPGDSTASVSTVMGLERSGSFWSYTYSGTTSMSDNPFSPDGYTFVMWSTSANSISGAKLPGETYSYSGSNYSQTINYYAVWVKIVFTETYHYTGSYITPTPVVTAYYGSSTASVIPTSISYENYINAGTATATITLPDTYLGAVVFATFIINPAVVTVDVSDASKIYGDADPSFTGTVTCPTASTDVLHIDYSRTPGENVGNYAITSTYRTNSNYSVTVNPGTLTIGKATVTITVDDASKNYGDADPSFTGTVVCDSAADTGVLAVSYFRTNAGIEDVGIYDGVLSAIYAVNGNFNVTVVPGDF